MESDRYLEVTGSRRGTTQEFRSAGFYPVGRKHCANQPSRLPLKGVAKLHCFGKTLKAALFIEVEIQSPRFGGQKRSPFDRRDRDTLLAQVLLQHLLLQKIHPTTSPHSR